MIDVVLEWGCASKPEGVMDYQACIKLNLKLWLMDVF